MEITTLSSDWERHERLCTHRIVHRARVHSATALSAHLVVLHASSGCAASSLDPAATVSAHPVVVVVLIVIVHILLILLRHSLILGVELPVAVVLVALRLVLALHLVAATALAVVPLAVPALIVAAALAVVSFALAALVVAAASGSRLDAHVVARTLARDQTMRSRRPRSASDELQHGSCFAESRRRVNKT